MNRVAAWFRRIWQVIVRWFTETCIIADPVEKAKRDAQRKKEKALAAIQAKLDSGRYEAVARWAKVKPARSRLPWFWRRKGAFLRAINPRRREEKAIMAMYGVDVRSGRQRRRFRKTLRRAVRARPAAVIALPDAPAPVAIAA